MDDITEVRDSYSTVHHTVRHIRLVVAQQDYPCVTRKKHKTKQHEPCNKSWLHSPILIPNPKRESTRPLRLVASVRIPLDGVWVWLRGTKSSVGLAKEPTALFTRHETRKRLSLWHSSGAYLTMNPVMDFLWPPWEKFIPSAYVGIMITLSISKILQFRQMPSFWCLTTVLMTWHAWSIPIINPIRNHPFVNPMSKHCSINSCWPWTLCTPVTWYIAMSNSVTCSTAVRGLLNWPTLGYPANSDLVLHQRSCRCGIDHPNSCWGAGTIQRQWTFGEPAVSLVNCLMASLSWTGRMNWIKFPKYSHCSEIPQCQPGQNWNICHSFKMAPLHCHYRWRNLNCWIVFLTFPLPAWAFFLHCWVIIPKHVERQHMLCNQGILWNCPPWHLPNSCRDFHLSTASKKTRQAKRFVYTVHTERESRTCDRTMSPARDLVDYVFFGFTKR